MKKALTQTLDLGRAAREIFDVALRSVDSEQAVLHAMELEGTRLRIFETTFELGAHPAKIYSLAIGKAAFPMARALDKILGGKICGGLIVGSLTGQNINDLNPVWRIIEGSHPLPGESSLRAARTAFDLLQRANDERALVIFLISGGGSAMIEWPRDERITLEDLREANRVLVSCGAGIAEINAVRHSFSALKGGGLASRAPYAEQLSLIVSDTGKGLETIVASGPTLAPPHDAHEAASIIARYNLAERLPASILRAASLIKVTRQNVSTSSLRKHYVLLDNETAIEAAAEEARRRGFALEIATDISEQPVAEGCALMMSRLSALRQRAAQENSVACVISGGEFACPVRGDGTGGRNAETVLRCAIEAGEVIGQHTSASGLKRFAMLSAGTDGIDGNSPAAGALANETTIERARRMNLDARSFLDRSDAYSFFNSLGDAIVTGPTGTNVRDLRIMLAED